MFHKSGLVLSHGRGQGTPLVKTSHMKLLRRQWTSKLMSLLWIKLPGVDPDRFLSWCVPKIGWVFSLFFAMLSFIFIMSGLLLVAVNFEEFQSKLPVFQEFFSASNVGWLMCGLAIAKILARIWSCDCV